MNPNSAGPEANMELPKPVTTPEKKSGEPKVEVASPAGVEKGGANQAAQAAPLMPTQDAASMALPSSATSATQAPAVPLTANIPAEDVDLIEKEWVNRAKDIVERTKNDPYVQNKEVNKLKAEYTEKRINKKLKLAD